MNKPPKIKKVVITEEQIKARLVTLAKEIEADYGGVEEPVYLIGILKSSFVFIADLVRVLDLPFEIHFMATANYAQDNAVKLVKDLSKSVANKHLVIIEDILDTGATLNYLARYLGSRGPASLRTCVLLDKIGSQVESHVKYIGFEVPEGEYVGYGIDYNEHYRGLPYIAEIEVE